MKILFLSRWYPYPPSNGSKIRIYNLLRGLANIHRITLVSFADQPGEKPDRSGLQSLCQSIRVVPFKAFQPNSFQALLGYFSRKPRSFVNTFSMEMKACIQQELKNSNYDLVIASEIDMADYSPFFSGVPAILEDLEIGVIYENFIRATSIKSKARAGLTWIKLHNHLSSLLKNFKVSTVVSEKERQYLCKIFNEGKKIEVIPNCVDLVDYLDVQETVQPDQLIFTGSFTYRPNYEAMQWFVTKVLPIIKTQKPDVHLTITGNHGNLSFPYVDKVRLTGFVDDIRPYIARSWASIVPLHVGGGTRLKILEAMALGTPVVATSKGAEGLDVEHGQHLLIADTPESFALETIRLLNDPILRQHLTSNAYHLIQEKYDWKAAMPSFLDLVDKCIYK
jgi:glycosyltransferase involved in cell wall biosynthesis